MNRPSVFTELNDRERFATMDTVRNNRMTNPASTVTPVFTPNRSDPPTASDGEWLLVGKNGKITASNRNQKQVLPIDIGHSCATATLPTEDESVHWQVEISFIPSSSQIVSVPKAMTAFLNHLQTVNRHTVLAPVHYKDATGDEYIVHSEDIPLNEQELTPYLVKYDNTRSGRIGLSVIIASTMTFNQFKQDKPLVKWFQAEKISVLLDMIDVTDPRHVGFFIRLLPKAESIDYHHMRIMSHIPDAPTFQLVARTLKTKNPKGGKDRSTTVLYAVADSDDCDTLAQCLRVMCDQIAGYEFYPLEEFLCLDHGDKISLINRQITFASKFASIVATGFNFEPPNFKMWMPDPNNHQSGYTNGTAIAIDLTEDQDHPDPPVSTTAPIPDNPTSMIVHAGPLTQDIPPEAWDDEMSDTPGNETVQFCDDSVTIFTTPVRVDSIEQVIQMHNTALVLTGQTQQTDTDTISTGTMEPPQSNKRLRTTNGSVATGVRPSVRPHTSSNDLSHLSISQFLYTVKSGDNTPLFSFVYEPVDGQRELLTTKYHEAAKFIQVVHPYLVRRMNPSARTIMYPNMEQEVNSALREPDWQPFRIFSQVAPMHMSHGSDTRTGNMLSRAQQQFHTSMGRGGGRMGNYAQAAPPDHTHWSCIRQTHQTNANTRENGGGAPMSATNEASAQRNIHMHHTTRSQLVTTASKMANVTFTEEATLIHEGGHSDSRVMCTGTTTTYMESANALTLLQTQLANMEMKQQSIETRMEQSVQSRINESITDLESRQAVQSKANNVELQAELNKNKQEMSTELSATMQFLKMLNDNAQNAKQQNDAFQLTVLQKLDVRDQEISSTQQKLTQQGAQLAQLAQFQHQPPAAKANSDGPLPNKLTNLGHNTTTIPRIGTLPRRQQQQSILATMARIGLPKEKEEEDTDMSRPDTDHDIDGTIHRSDPGTTGSAHQT